MSKHNVVWEVVKHPKEKTSDGVVVDAKYTHVCVSRITTTEAGEMGTDGVRPPSTVPTFMGRRQQRTRPSYIFSKDWSRLEKQIGKMIAK